MRSKTGWAVATWFGCGYWPWGPGTMGSLGAAVPAFLLVRYAGWPAWWFAVLAALAAPAGIWAASVVARESGRKDPQIVVVDEVLGQWITLAAAGSSVLSFAAAFVLFRLFDMWKPAPVRQLERLPGGTGIVADDLMAGIYGALVLAAARWLA